MEDLWAPKLRCDYVEHDEFLQDKAMLQGSLDAANEQVEQLQRGVDAWQKTAEDYERENEQLREERDEAASAFAHRKGLNEKLEARIMKLQREVDRLWEAEEFPFCGGCNHPVTAHPFVSSFAARPCNRCDCDIYHTANDEVERLEAALSAETADKFKHIANAARLRAELDEYEGITEKYMDELAAADAEVERLVLLQSMLVETAKNRLAEVEQLRAEKEASQGLWGNMALADAADKLYRSQAEVKRLRAEVKRLNYELGVADYPGKSALVDEIKRLRSGPIERRDFNP